MPFGSGDQRGETSLSFASIPTTTSNHGSRSTTSNHGSGSNHGSRSGSSDGKHSNEDAADCPMEPTEDHRDTSFSTRSGVRKLDPTWALPTLPANNSSFPSEMADCLRELLSAQKGVAAVPPPMASMPQMPDGLEFKDFMASFEMPAEEPPKPPARDSEQQNRVQVQYVPVPCISTPYGLCPLPPMNVLPQHARAGVASPTEEALEKAVAACPEGFTLMPAAEVYKEYPDLQQKKHNFESYAFDQPDTSKDATPDYFPTTASPMLESF